jgi:2,7-dihydroxy-5-methyl-1-naphthoate 7-O-methyltransferase
MTTLRPRLVVAGAARAISFYGQVFGAEEIARHEGPDGRIVHAELAIGAGRLTLKDEDDVDSAGGSLLTLTVDDADAVAGRMVAAGGTVVFPVEDREEGRGGRLADPFGHRWIIVQAWEQNPLTDLSTPWCVHAVATLGVAGHLEQGITGVGELAAAAGCDADALHNVLGHLAGKGLFAETGPGRFALTETGRRLFDDPFLDLSGIGGRMAYAWGTLPTYLRTGRAGYHEVFGRPFWDDLDAHPDVAASFNALIGPRGHGVPDPELGITGGWEQVGTVVDVGGGTGAMLAEILRAHPDIRGTLVDLPGAVAEAAETFRTAGVADRVTTSAQSFFDPLPAGADVYLLKNVLNDWPDEETVAILRRCAEAAGPGGRVVVTGGVSPDGASRGLTVEMVLLGGTTSTVAEFRGLAQEAGLEVATAGRTPSGRFVVECRVG